MTVGAEPHDESDDGASDDDIPTNVTQVAASVPQVERADAAMSHPPPTPSWPPPHARSLTPAGFAPVHFPPRAPALGTFPRADPTETAPTPESKTVTIVDSMPNGARLVAEVVTLDDDFLIVRASDSATRRFSRITGFELREGGSWSTWRLSGSDFRLLRRKR